MHVVGNGPDDPAPPGWVDTPEYTAETGASHHLPPAHDQPYCCRRVSPPSPPLPTPAPATPTPRCNATHLVGWVDKAKIEKYCFPPAEDTLLFVCGLPPMYDALCAPPAPARHIQSASAPRSALPPSLPPFSAAAPSSLGAPGGPRTEKAIKEGSVLHQLGYTADMVAKM